MVELPAIPKMGGRREDGDFVANTPGNTCRRFLRMSNGDMNYLASHCRHECGRSDTDNQGADSHHHLHLTGTRA